MIDFATLRDYYVRGHITPVEYILTLAASSYMPPNVQQNREYTLNRSYRLEGTTDIRNRTLYFQVTIRQVDQHCAYPDEGCFTVDHENQIYSIEAYIQTSPIESTQDDNNDDDDVVNIPDRIKRIGFLAGSVCL